MCIRDSLTCGAVRMEFMRFFLADATAALISVPLMLWLGFVCAEYYETALKALDQVRIYSIVVLLLVVALWFVHHRKSAQASDEEEPNEEEKLTPETGNQEQKAN